MHPLHHEKERERERVRADAKGVKFRKLYRGWDEANTRSSLYSFVKLFIY